MASGLMLTVVVLSTPVLTPAYAATSNVCCHHSENNGNLRNSGNYHVVGTSINSGNFGNSNAAVNSDNSINGGNTANGSQYVEEGEGVVEMSLH